MSVGSFEAYLHGLVDDEVDERRRADALSKLCLSSGDTERLVNWRRQNQLLRAAFAGVESETVPLALSLASTPKQVGRTFGADHDDRARADRHRFVAGIVGLLAVAAVFAIALWPVHMPPPPDLMPVATIVAERPTGDAPGTVLRHARGLVSNALDRSDDLRLPSLESIGFSFLEATSDDRGDGHVACGTYLSASHRRVALCVTPSAGPSHAMGSRLWQVGAKLYALAGDATDGELRDVAAVVRRKASGDD